MNSSCNSNTHCVMQNHTFFLGLMQKRKHPWQNELKCMLISDLCSFCLKVTKTKYSTKLDGKIKFLPLSLRYHVEK